METYKNWSGNTIVKAKTKIMEVGRERMTEIGRIRYCQILEKHYFKTSWGIELSGKDLREVAKIIEKMEWKFEENKAECEGKCVNRGTKKEIIITERAERQIRTLIKHIPALEWMAILQGEEKENKIIITGMELPEQEATTGHIEVTKDGSIQAQETKNKIGWIHSHNTMNAFFSQNDIETASQHTISIVINNRLETKGLIKVTRPCGTKALEEIQVKTERQEEDDKETLTAIKEKVIEKRYTTTQWDGKQYWNGYGITKDNKKEEATDAWEKYWQEESRPKGMSKKEWKRVKKERRERQLKELEGISKGWIGECQECFKKITEEQPAIFESGLLYHEECVNKMEKELNKETWTRR